jgi:hypothetical protein
MIYCVWYPSGGFGHFINGILTLHGKEFKRPNNKIEFSATGNSHNLELVAPKYTKYTENYNFEFDSNYNYSVLIDLGINSNSCEFMLSFPNSTIIKMCYTDVSWPIVAKTMIDKAMKSTVESEITVDAVLWEATKDWTQREKYFLFLRDHHLRNAWQPKSDINNNIIIDSLMNYNELKNIIEAIGPELDDFDDLWNKWYLSNKKYFAPVTKAKQIIETIKISKNLDLTSITDIWTQAVIYYFIWLEFGKEVPHNEFEHFFNDVDQIRTWLDQ